MIDLRKTYGINNAIEVKIYEIIGDKVFGAYRTEHGHWFAGNWSVETGKFYSAIPFSHGEWLKLVEVEYTEGLASDPSIDPLGR